MAATEVLADDDDTAIAAITVAELQVGVSLASGRTQEARQALLDALVEAVPVISYNLSVARAHAELLVATRRAGKPRGAHDLIIAATALAGGRIVVTADPRGFEGLPGLRIRYHGQRP